MNNYTEKAKQRSVFNSERTNNNRMTELQKEYCEEKGLSFTGIPINGVHLEYITWLETQIQSLRIKNVVKSLPNDEEVKAHIDALPYYGNCTTEYNEGFEDGVKWLKEQLAN